LPETSFVLFVLTFVFFVVKVNFCLTAKDAKITQRSQRVIK